MYKFCIIETLSGNLQIDPYPCFEYPKCMTQELSWESGRWNWISLVSDLSNGDVKKYDNWSLPRFKKTARALAIPTSIGVRFWSTLAVLDFLTSQKGATKSISKCLLPSCASQGVEILRYWLIRGFLALVLLCRWHFYWLAGFRMFVFGYVLWQNWKSLCGPRKLMSFRWWKLFFECLK